MGNKAGTANNGSMVGANKHKIKALLDTLQTTIFPTNAPQYILLAPNFDVLTELSYSPSIMMDKSKAYSLFSKLKITAKQFARTLGETETTCIHLTKNRIALSYYTLNEYHLLIRWRLNSPQNSPSSASRHTEQTTAKPHKDANQRAVPNVKTFKNNNQADYDPQLKKGIITSHIDIAEIQLPKDPLSSGNFEYNQGIAESSKISLQCRAEAGPKISVI
ncbi:uncharacterized protein LOC126315375 [Schistocerca gregaria]|uniref:uncharacterized protein LOC126315375 n=1 Tax=Schistocerca gregaria TaxID=7010 RepID=UPI00211E2E14|nr:uncharacterized protein LOC126315375 [Schistocerca gregaria]